MSSQEFILIGGSLLATRESVNLNEVSETELEVAGFYVDLTNVSLADPLVPSTIVVANTGIKTLTEEDAKSMFNTAKNLLLTRVNLGISQASTMMDLLAEYSTIPNTVDKNPALADFLAEVSRFEKGE